MPQKLHATTGIATKAYGENPFLKLHAPDADHRVRAAATYRAAAMLEEAMAAKSTCAICVEAQDGYIHLEFSERASQAEQSGAQTVLETVAAAINAGGAR
jgi:hypothetical protein